MLGGRDDRIALVDAATGERITYGALRARVAERAVALRPAAGPAGIGVAFAGNDVATIVELYAALATGVPIALLDRQLDDRRARAWIERYRPEVVTGRAFGGPLPRGGAAPHRDLALLLSTSGTLGSPRMVRLAGAAVEANARAIAEALAIGPDEIAVTSLPLAYAYGLSIVTSHLAAGATVVVTAESVVSERFWRACRDHGVTSLAGVPYTYEMLRRVELTRVAPPTLRTLTQAGGALAPAQIRHFHAIAAARGGGLIVMYGQTEATARISVLPASELPARAGAVGRAIPGGAIAIAPDGGEIVFRGPSVMMGYAGGRDDLARGDELGGELWTGDRGVLDRDGLLWITGRSRRIAKVFGQRIDLDELEAIARALAGTSAVAAIARGDRVRVFVEAGSAATAIDTRALAEATGLHGRGFELVELPVLPRLASGKLDYQALAEAP